MWLNVQGDSKKKCLILKNLWTMSFWDLERIGTNDWIIGVMRRWVYIERSGRCKISTKSNKVNRFTKCVNRFRQQKYKPEIYEDWYDSVKIWINSSEPRMKKYTIQPFMNQFHACQKVFMMQFKIWRIDSMVMRFKFWWIVSFEVRNFRWYDSKYDESIQLVKRWELDNFQIS